MDTNFRNIIMMDVVRLETEVRQKALEYLDDISEGNLKAFAESTKNIAQSVLENYFLAVDDIYTNGALKLENSEIYNKFIDFHDGYRAQMKKWATENEITIGEMVITPTLQYPEIENENITKKPIAIAGVGTLVAAGLIIFSKMWIAVAAELLTLGVSAYSYKKSKESRETRYAFRVKKYEMQIEQEKARLVNGLIKDLKTWLGNAESFSNDVILKFGIQ
jgi:hypothetical protein